MIEAYRFGQITVDGRHYQNDIKIIAGSVVSGWWRQEGHSLDVGDIDDILAANPQVLVVGMGQPGRMQVLPELRTCLRERGIELVEEPTEQAVAVFNRFSGEGRKVAGAFHITC
jgi:hypothetical protein